MSTTPPAPERLRLDTKVFFGIGSAAEAIALYSVTAYALFYYNQVLGLPAELAGLAISASLFLDGISIRWSARCRTARARGWAGATPICSQPRSRSACP